MGNRKSKFSKTGLILIGSTLVCLILVLAVGVPNGFFGDGGKGGDLDDDGTPSFKTVVDGKTPLLIFDKSEAAQVLMESFDEGQLTKVELLYDQMGGNEPIESEDQKVIKEAYKALKNIVILEPTEETVTDSYHYVYFTTENGSELGYAFEGSGIIIIDSERYKIEGSGGLWDLYRQLAE